MIKLFWKKKRWKKLRRAGQDDKEKPGQAIVVAVGPGGVVDGKDITMQVKKGQHVLFSRYSGTEVELEGKKYTVVKQSDILAIVE